MPENVVSPETLQGAAPGMRLEQWPLLYRVFEGTIRKAEPAPAPEGEGERAAETPPELTEYEVSISSEEPVERWFGTEVLSHSKGAVDMSGLRGSAPAPLLWMHDPEKMVGSIRDARLTDDKRIRGRVRFLRADPFAQQLRQGVEDGDIGQVSVGYQILRVKRVRAGDPEAGTKDEYLVTRWRPREASVVSMAADQTVGFGRGRTGDDKYPVEIEEGDDAAIAAAAPTEERAMPENKTTPDVPASGNGNGTIDVGASRDASADIVRLCTAHGRAIDAADMIQRGLTLKEAKAELLDRIGTSGAAQPARETSLDLPAKDAKRYSFARAIYQKYLESADEGTFDGIEAEVDQEIRKHLPPGYAVHAGGLFVPHRLGQVPEVARKYGLVEGERMARQTELGTRAYPLDTATTTEGKELVFTSAGEFIDMLRARLAVSALGARTISGLVGNVSFPRQTAAGTAAFIAEESAATDSQLALDSVPGSPKIMMSTTGYTRSLLAQATPDIDPIVRADLAAIHARLLDKKAVHGSGVSPEPKGIYNTTGVTVINCDPAAGNVNTVPTYSKVIDLIGAVGDANADMGPLAFLTTPLLAATLKRTLVASAAGSDMIWTGNFQNGSMAGYPAMASNTISKVMADLAETGGSEHGTVFGNWAELLLLLWGAMELVVDPYSAKKSGRIELTTFQLVDIAVRHGASFAVFKNAIP